MHGRGGDEPEVGRDRAPLEYNGGLKAGEQPDVAHELRARKDDARTNRKLVGREETLDKLDKRDAQGNTTWNKVVVANRDTERRQKVV